MGFLLDPTPEREWADISLINGRRVMRVAPNVSEFCSAAPASTIFDISFHKKSAYVGTVGIPSPFAFFW